MTEVRKIAERWKVELEVEVEDGVTRRTFEANSCAEAVDVMALIVAAAINPGGEDLEPASVVPPPLEPPPTPESEEEREPVLAPVLPPSVESPGPGGGVEPPTPAAEGKVVGRRPETTPRSEDPVRSTEFRLVGSAHAGIAFGLLPRVGADLGGFVGARRGRLELGATARVVTPRTLLEDGNGGRFTLWTAGARACGRTSQRVFVGGCGALELGGLTAQGVGFDQNDRRTSLWSGAAASAWIGYRLGATSIRLEPALVVGLLRPAFGGENTTFDQELGRFGFRANFVFFFEGR